MALAKISVEDIEICSIKLSVSGAKNVNWFNTGKVNIYSSKLSIYLGNLYKNIFICSIVIIQTGIKTAIIINNEMEVTIIAAIFRGIFFVILSTIGFKEQAITNDAKNIMAMSLQVKIKVKNSNNTIKNIIFFEFTYFFTAFSNIKSPKILF